MSIISAQYPHVPLGEIARSISRPLPVEPGKAYRTLGVKWWGEGAYERQTIDGAATAAKVLSLVRENDLSVTKICGRLSSEARFTPSRRRNSDSRSSVPQFLVTLKRFNHQ